MEDSNKMVYLATGCENGREMELAHPVPVIIFCIHSVEHLGYAT
jgi:hypothetical protein